jgi:hypothetical protein
MARAQAPAWPSIPGGLDDLIVATQCLLMRLRSLGSTDLRTAAANLRILSNYAEAWAQRTEQAGSDQDPPSSHRRYVIAPQASIPRVPTGTAALAITSTS